MFPLSHCPHCKSRSSNIKVEAVYIGKELMVASCVVCGWAEYGQIKADKSLPSNFEFRLVSGIMMNQN